MSEPGFLSYLKTLKPEDWDLPVSDKWKVGDVVAHMIGWEKIDPEVIRETWQTKKRPWFYETDDFDEFNRKNVEFYRGYTPDQFIAEWEKYRTLVQKEIDIIGEEKLRAQPELFGWLFEQEEKENGHYNIHYRQIRNVVENKFS